MKHKWIICLLAMLLPFSAQAWEDPQYISPEDSVYWHANASCQGEFLLESDGAEGYFPCPVCVEIHVDPKVTAVERGGTIILKLPDSWANSRENVGSVFGWSAADRYEGDEAKLKAAEYLHGDAYNAFMKSWEETGKAEAWTWEPGIYPENNELFMNQRHIGNAWYVTMRPDKVSGDSIRIYLRFFGGIMKAEGDVLTVDRNDEWGDTDYKLKFSQKKNKNKSYSRDFAGFSIDIYDELGTHIAVIRQDNADKDLLENVRLVIAEEPAITLDGYMNGKDAVYCCTLTDGEDHLIRNGGGVSLMYDEWYSEEDFNGTDYAVVEKGTAGYGVIDRNANFVLGPGYRSIVRLGNTVFITKQNKDAEVINLDTMATIGSFECPKGDYVGLYPLNSAVYGVFIQDVWYLYEMATGFPLAVLPVDEPESPSYPHVSGGVDGRYFCFENGMPQRLVFWQSVTAYEHSAWLADNHGNRISDNYTLIEPLIWNDNKGVFAIQKYTDFENVDYPNNPEKYLQGFAGQPHFGDDWRVGLMDQDGNIIAPMEYVYIKVHSPAEIELHREDGTVETVGAG
ncbi:MAG: hypothetical protein E7337_11490 [Clostridiales bacterium]|nr:hypothetical protein [Clostridiales bacterium]